MTIPMVPGRMIARLPNIHNKTGRMRRAATSVLCALAVVASVVEACDVSLADFGAHGNGIDYDDEALTAALAKCSDGGIITFPSGKYLLSPFELKSNMELRLEKGSVLLATTDWSRWPVVPPLPSYPDVRGKKDFVHLQLIFNTVHILI